MGEPPIGDECNRWRGPKVLTARDAPRHTPLNRNNLHHGAFLQSKAASKQNGNDTRQRRLHSCSTSEGGTTFFISPKAAAARCRQIMPCGARAGVPRLAAISPGVGIVAGKEQQKKHGRRCFANFRRLAATALFTRTSRRCAREGPASSLPEFSATEHPPPAILASFGCPHDLTKGHATPLAKANQPSSHTLSAY